MLLLLLLKVLGDPLEKNIKKVHLQMERKVAIRENDIYKLNLMCKTLKKVLFSFKKSS